MMNNTRQRFWNPRMATVAFHISDVVEIIEIYAATESPP